VLSRVDIENFRCIESATLELSPRATGIVGSNGSGKTSVLEAIYFLGHGRSFRTSQRERLLRTGARDFRVVARIAVAERTLVAGMEYAAGTTRVHLAGQPVSSLAEIAGILPIQVIDPGVHRLIEEGSSRRRRLMDWGVFHVEPDFLRSWRRYQRALQQRNAALRALQGPADVATWEGELIASGEIVDRLRRTYVERLEPHFQRLAASMIGGQARFTYRRGWPGGVSLGDAYADARPRDLRLRTSSVGPHRADLGFIVDDDSARDRVSRGQQKMLASAFVLAQLSLRAAEGAPPACLMLDDPAAELDVDNLGKLLRAVAEIPAQLIVTSVQERGLEGLAIERMFHVKQGRFTPMV